MYGSSGWMNSTLGCTSSTGCDPSGWVTDPSNQAPSVKMPFQYRQVFPGTGGAGVGEYSGILPVWSKLVYAVTPASHSGPPPMVE